MSNAASSGTCFARPHKYFRSQNGAKYMTPFITLFNYSIGKKNRSEGVIS